MRSKSGDHRYGKDCNTVDKAVNPWHMSLNDPATGTDTFEKIKSMSYPAIKLWQLGEKEQ
jgi:hypothetical protein